MKFWKLTVARSARISQECHRNFTGSAPGCASFKWASGSKQFAKRALTCWRTCFPLTFWRTYIRLTFILIGHLFKTDIRLHPAFHVEGVSERRVFDLAHVTQRHEHIPWASIWKIYQGLPLTRLTLQALGKSIATNPPGSRALLLERGLWKSMDQGFCRASQCSMRDDNGSQGAQRSVTKVTSIWGFDYKFTNYYFRKDKEKENTWYVVTMDSQRGDIECRCWICLLSLKL